MPEAPQRCGSCDAELLGEYCHGCGQRRVSGRLTLRAFLTDVSKKVLRADLAFPVTFKRALIEPGPLVDDYLAGRRKGILDPLHYFISSVFVQILVSALTRSLAPAIHRDSATSWLAVLGGMVASKFALILFAGALWRLLFRARHYNLAEMYVFSIYVAATTGLLWSLLPIIDLIVPFPIASSDRIAAVMTLGIELVYLTWAVRSWVARSYLTAFLCTSTVLLVGYALLVLLIGSDAAADLAPLSALTP